MEVGLDIHFKFRLSEFVRLPFNDQFGFVLGCYWTGAECYYVQSESGQREYYPVEVLSRVNQLTKVKMETP